MDNFELVIAKRPIGPAYPPYVIAEISANHNGSIETAKKLIREAKSAGADAVKLQTYKPDTMTIDCSQPDFLIRDGLWAGSTLFDLYEQAHLPWDWHKPLFEEAKKIGITIFSSPFDNTAIDLLEDLGTPAYKIASFEVVDLALIAYAASTGKPMIISTGMADGDEIQEAIEAAREGGCKELAILHCVSGYPAPAEDYNLRTITDMQRRYVVPTGLSDHTFDNITAFASIGLGGCIIEKHFTLDRTGGGPDDSFSLEPAGLRELCSGALTAWKSLGRVDYDRKPSEEASIQFRRSLYFVSDIKAGEVVTGTHVRSIRPGFGLEPKQISRVIGKAVLQDTKRGTPVSWALLAD